MRKKQAPRRLVIDASVAQSAGISEKEPSKSCRRTLETIKHAGHWVVLSATQKAEWKKHQTQYSAIWLATMVAEKRFCVVAPEPDSGLHAAVVRHVPEAATDIRKEMLKDVFLFEIALATDLLILSRDEKAFGYFEAIVPHIPALGTVAWVNPEAPADGCIGWLEAGAAHAPERCVGQRARYSAKKEPAPGRTRRR